jgi:hypothetical protein
VGSNAPTTGFPSSRCLCSPASTPTRFRCLSGHEQLATYTDETITTAAFASCSFKSSPTWSYAATTGLPKRTPAWTDEVVSRNITDYLAYGMAITTTYTILSGFTDLDTP